MLSLLLLLTISDCFPEVQFEELFNVHEKIHISSVANIEATEDRIYLKDWDEYYIHKFDYSGERIRKYGLGEGRGPGEIAFGIDFALAGEHLVLLDREEYKFVVLDKDNNVIQEETLEAMPTYVVPVRKEVVS